MNFAFLKFAPLVIVGLILAIYFMSKQNKNFLGWVQDHWFLRPSKWFNLGTICLYVSFTLFALALLDFRGKPKEQEQKVPKQKTLILIDNSLSMLAEDVYPNRLKKAIYMAKHYVKNATGQDISVMVFSETYRQIVPFTDDYSLLEARLSAIENLRLIGGGSNIFLTLQEAIGFFRKKNTSDVRGNILMFTDAENHDEKIAGVIPEGISLGIVAVGTLAGAKIPRRGVGGTFVGWKRHKGEEIVSRVSEKSLKRLKDNVKNFEYWLAPKRFKTREILKFFSDKHNGKFEQKTVRTAPVYMELLVIPGIIFYLLYVFFCFLRRFEAVGGSLCILFLLLSSPVKNANASTNEESIQGDLIELRNGDLNHEKKLNLANKLLKSKQGLKSLTLYDESYKGNSTFNQLNHAFNYGTLLLKSGEVAKGLKVYRTLLSQLNKSDEEHKEIEKGIKANTQLALMQQKNKKKSGKGSSKGKKNQKGKGKGEGGEDSSGSQGGGQESDQDNQGNKSQPKRYSNKNKQKNNNKNKNIKAILKQLAHSDRSLQRKVLDTKTKKDRRGIKRGEGNVGAIPEKDW